MSPRYTSFTNLGTAAAQVPLTAGVYVAASGVVHVGGPNSLVNLGTVQAGAQFDGWGITQIGTANTAQLIALR